MLGTPLIEAERQWVGVATSWGYARQGAANMAYFAHASPFDAVEARRQAVQVFCGTCGK